MYKATRIAKGKLFWEEKKYFLLFDISYLFCTQYTDTYEYITLVPGISLIILTQAMKGRNVTGKTEKLINQNNEKNAPNKKNSVRARKIRF